MTPERWRKIDELLDKVLDIEPSGRDEFLASACAGDEPLRRELESLLLAHEQSTGFAETLPTEVTATLFPPRPVESMLGRSLAHYEVLSSLGTGGMGQVYLARDTKLGRPVALKLLPAHYQDKNRIDRFRQEACAASALNHPNILTVYEIGQQDERHFIATEYVEGETLRQHINRRSLTLSRAIDVASQIASALGAAHAAGIVHRDIKPDNIMLRPDGLVKVVDFGVAKLTQSARFLTDPAQSAAGPQTDAGVLVGTIDYMSPEQVRGQSVDGRSDLFSLGVVLFEMVTGVRPFAGETKGDVIAALLHKNHAPLSALISNANAELERIVNTCLAKPLDRRYRSAADLHSDLKALSRQIEAGAGPNPVACPRCGQENPEGFAYCGLCGTALTRTCPRCGRESVFSNQFCGVCGNQFWGAPQTSTTTGPFGQAYPVAASAGAERRHVTILYAMLSGCSAILEQLDPGEAQSVITSIKSSVTEVITRFDGVVDRCSGEEVIALFGVPTSHEDDFVRGVRASLSLQVQLNEFSRVLEGLVGTRLRISTGISSGPVVVRPAEQEKYSGETLQIASRLAHAATDEILLSPETCRLVAPFFSLSEKGSISLKPGAGPVTIYRVEGESGVRTRLEAAEVSGLTPYTGRERELALLLSSVQRSLAGDGQLVTVVGEAGVGKSRLLLEFLRTLEQQSVTLLQTRCQSQGTSTAYLPFIDVLRDLLGLDPDELPDVTRANLPARVRAIDPDLEGYLPVFLHLLSIHEDNSAPESDLHGDDWRFAIQEALSAIFTLHTRREPTVLLFEDWHWADEGSAEALKRLAGFVPAHPMMVIVTSRSHATLDSWYSGGQSVLQLAPLDESSSIRIVKSVLGADELPEGLGRLLYMRTGGNPFFIEEVCRTLMEESRVEVVERVARLVDSVQDLQLPDTVQTVIRTRLDRLDPESQTVLRHASVIGREFNLPLLQRMLDDRAHLRGLLASLQRQGLIQQVRVVPEPVYRFKHVVTQEVVYESLLAHHRKALHESAGRAIEELYDGRLEEQLEMLTHHYSLAENWSKASRFGQESAEKASRLSRFAEALAVLDQTEIWLSKLEDQHAAKEMLVSVLLKQERLCETLGLRERQRVLIDRILALAEASPDEALVAEALVRRGELDTLLGRFEEAEASLTESLKIRRSLGDSSGERIALRNMGFLYWRTARYEDALDCNHTALEIDQSQGDSASYAKDLTNLASILRSQGRLREALSYLKEALEINEILNRPVSQVYTLAVLANVHRDLDETDLAMRYYQRADDLSTQHRLPLHRVVILNLLAATCWQQGGIDESLRMYNELVSLTRSHGVKKELVRALETLSERLLALERIDEALPKLREAAQVFAELGEANEQARILTSVAYLCERRPSDAADAVSAWATVRSLKRTLEDLSGELEALEGMARVARGAANDSGFALQCLTQACELARQLGDSAKEGDLLNTAAIVEWTNGRYDASLARYEAALSIFQSLGDSVHAGLMLNSIGVTLHKLGRRDEAIVRLEDALRLHRESGERLLEGHALAALGDVLCEMGAHDEASRRYQASLEIRKEKGDRNGEGWMLQRLAATLFTTGDAREARKLLHDAAVIADEIADNPLKTACQSLEARQG